MRDVCAKWAQLDRLNDWTKCKISNSIRRLGKLFSWLTSSSFKCWFKCHYLGLLSTLTTIEHPTLTSYSHSSLTLSYVSSICSLFVFLNRIWTLWRREVLFFLFGSLLCSKFLKLEQAHSWCSMHICWVNVMNKDLVKSTRACFVTCGK